MSNKCFANKNSKCKALTVSKCEGHSCSFFKTAKEQKESLKKAYTRIAVLQDQVQKHISDKYIGGEYPWLEEGDVYGC